VRQRIWNVFAICLWIIFIAGKARADRSPFDAWAEWMTTPHGKWKGQVVPYPDHEECPGPQPLLLRSWLYPLSVHAPTTVSFDQAEQALLYLEQAYERLAETGWPLPLPDGGVGGNGDFDLFLVPESRPPAAAYADGAVLWTLFDSATAYGVVNPRVQAQSLPACVVSALVQAALLEQDPAEAPSWRQATGAFVAWLATGQFGCDQAVVDQQLEPWRGWIGAEPGSGAGAAFILAMLSESQDGGTGTFIRELWQFARQKSQLSDALRGSPDLFEALARALENSGQSLDKIAVDLAVARYFAGPSERRRAAPYFALRTLPTEAAVPVVDIGGLDKLPRHLPAADPPIETFGSGYFVVDTAGSSLPMQLEIWLRGEYGARWSLVAVRLAADGREVGRVAAPPKRDPNSYLTVELTPDTAKVLMVVTNLIDGAPDADCNTRNVHSFELLIDARKQVSASK
jgi:hypothetical protein